MAMVRGLAATNFGRAVSETADALDRERQFQQARSDRRAELDMRLDAKLEEIMLRYGLTGTAGGRRSGSRGGGVPAQRTEEELAALAGLDVPSFRRAQRVHQTGGEQEVKTTADDPGMAYATEEDRQSIAGRGLIGDSMDTIAGRRDAARYRRGIVHAAMDPADVDDFEKGQALATARDLAFDEDPRKVERARLGQRAMEGKDRFTVAGDEKIDEAEGFRGPTDVGRSRIDENRAQAERARADSADRAPGGGKALSEAIKTVDAQRKTLQGERTNLRMQRDSELRNATGRAAKQRIADDYAERERDLDRRLEDLDRQYDELRRKQGLPARGAAADSSQTGDAPPVSMLKEGIRTRFANGQVWTLRGGKPVRVQ